MLHLFSDTYSNIGGRLTTKEVGGCQYLNWVSYSRAYKTFFAIFCHWGNWYANMRKKKCVVTHIRLKVACIFASSVLMGKTDDVRKFVYKNKFTFVYFTLESFTFHIHIGFAVLWKLAFIAGWCKAFYIKATHFLLCRW